MKVFGVERVLAVRGVVFADVERVEDSIDALHVRNIATKSDYGGIVKRTKTLYIREPGERAI